MDARIIKNNFGKQALHSGRYATYCSDEQCDDCLPVSQTIGYCRGVDFIRFMALLD